MGAEDRDKHPPPPTFQSLQRPLVAEPIRDVGKVERWFASLRQRRQKVGKVLVAQSPPIVCNPVDCSPPGSSVHGILQARILECVAIPFSRGSSRPRDLMCVSCRQSHQCKGEVWGPASLSRSFTPAPSVSSC